MFRVELGNKVLEGKAYVSVDFDHDGICDEQGVLISISTIEKVGIDQQCILASI